MKQCWMYMLLPSFLTLAGCGTFQTMPTQETPTARALPQIHIDVTEGNGIPTTSGYWRIRGELVVDKGNIPMEPGSVSAVLTQVLKDSFWQQDEYFLVTVKPTGAALPAFPAQQVVKIDPNRDVSLQNNNTFWLTPIIDSYDATNVDLEVKVIRVSKVKSRLVESFSIAVSAVAPMINPAWTLTAPLKKKIEEGAAKADTELNKILSGETPVTRQLAFTPFPSGGSKAIEKITVSLEAEGKRIKLFEIKNESLETMFSPTNSYSDIPINATKIYTRKLGTNNGLDSPDDVLTKFSVLDFLSPPRIPENYQKFCEIADRTLISQSGLSAEDRAVVIWAYLDDKDWTAVAKDTPKPSSDRCLKILGLLDSHVPNLKYYVPAYKAP